MFEAFLMAFNMLKINQLLLQLNSLLDFRGDMS